jgi:hypothetical protein
MANHTASGQLDPSFNGGQLLDLEFEGFEDNVTDGVATDRAGVIYVAGARFSAAQGYSQYFIVALDAQGRPHADFGAEGRLVGAFYKPAVPGVKVDSRAAQLRYVADDADPQNDRLLLLGTYTIDSNGHARTYPALACHKLNGDLDVTFGDNGIRIFPGLEGSGSLSFAHNGAPAGIPTRSAGLYEVPGAYGRLQWSLHDRRLYIAGVSVSQTQTLVICIDLDGVIDWGFGNNGVQAVERAGQRVFLSHVYADARGVYLSGSTSRSGSEGFHAVIARLKRHGELDIAFAEGGFKDFEDLKGNGMAAITSTPEGYFVGAGDYVSLLRQPMLFGFDGEGVPNPHFNGGSPVVLSLDRPAGWDAVGAADGRIVVLGNTRGYRHSGLVARYMLDGSLDEGFAGGAGWRILDELPNYSTIWGLIVRNDQSIVFTGVRVDEITGREVGIIGVLTGR